MTLTIRYWGWEQCQYSPRDHRIRCVGVRCYRPTSETRRLEATGKEWFPF